MPYKIANTLTERIQLLKKTQATKLHKMYKLQHSNLRNKRNKENIIPPKFSNPTIIDEYMGLKIRNHLSCLQEMHVIKMQKMHAKDRSDLRVKECTGCFREVGRKNKQVLLF